MNGILAYASYLPRHRLALAEIGALLGGGAGKGSRVVASFDEDSTTMGTEAALALLRTSTATPGSLYFATTSPSYLDKTNAATMHAALGLPAECFAADLAGSARSWLAAWRAAAATGGLAVAADVRVGRPGSADERGGGDGAAAFLFGDAAGAIAEIAGYASTTGEFLDRWRAPGAQAAEQWEERFGFGEYQPLIRETVARVLGDAGVEQADHVVLVCPNQSVVKRAAALVPGRLSTGGSPIGHAGAADAGLGLAAVLDQAEPEQTVLVVSAVDGCDAVLLRTTERIARSRPVPVAEQLDAGVEVSYPDYLSWRGQLVREPPRRPEPQRPAAPPSARAQRWKFGFTASRCLGCSFVHLPPARVCKKCGARDKMTEHPLAGAHGTVATYTVDRLAYSPAPPLVDAVVDFDGGGRYTLEVADAAADRLAVGTRVSLTFRRLFTADGVHNYFWKARVD